MNTVEIESRPALDARLASGLGLAGAYVQSVDLTGRGPDLLAAGVAGAVFLGCVLEPGVDRLLVDAGALVGAGFGLLARELIEEYGASLGETLNIVLRGEHATLAPSDHSNVALETPARRATVLSGLSQARMGAHWFE